jgi:acyl-CoA thioester hydrolase
LWSAPVRFAEVDLQGVVFNSHFLLYCDEAMGLFCAERDMLDVAEHVHLVTSTLTWRTPARWGDVLDVHTECTRIGTSSFGMRFDIRAGERSCCLVETTYVLVENGSPVPLPDEVRAKLS